MPAYIPYAEIDLTVLPASDLIEFRRRGVTDDDLRVALFTQQQQRAADVPVLPLTVQLGLEPLRPNMRQSVGAQSGQFVAALGAVLAGHRRPNPLPRPRAAHRTGQPVHPNSVQTGTEQEAAYVQPMSPEGRADLMKGFRDVERLAFNLRHIARIGARPLTDIETLILRFNDKCFRIMRYLLDTAEYRNGWCFPSYESVADAAIICRRTAARYLKMLREMGFLDWLRRFDYTKTDEGARSKQASNLYRCQIPAPIAKLINWIAPLPDDETARREAALEDDATMLSQLSEAARSRFMPSDVGQRAALLLAAARADLRIERESQECNPLTEPQDNLYNYVQREFA